jgi:alpha-galactosidase
MLIDNCASGGRRLDFEMLSNSIPLCQSDYPCLLDYDREAVQTENYYIGNWIPLHSAFTWQPDHDPYEFFCSVGTGISCKKWQYESRSPNSDHDWNFLRKTLEDTIKIRNILMNGDYYPLSEKPENMNNWCAYHGHVPNDGHGFIIAFRREKSKSSREIYRLAGLDKEINYELEFYNGEKMIIPGKDLTEELIITLEKPRSMELIFYREERRS